MKKYRAIIYDIDGTLLNTLEMNMYPLIQIIKEETGQQLSLAEVLKYAPYPGLKVMEELQVKEPQKTYARWVKYVNEYEKGASLYPGVKEVLATFQAHGLIQAVVSAKTAQQYQIDMVAHGLDAYMQTAILADDTKKHKPDPEPLHLCLKRLQIKPSEAIYIGDALADFKAAKAAKIDFGYAKWGSLTPFAVADALVFEEPLALLKLLEQ